MFGWEGFPPFNAGGLGVACYGLSKAMVEQGIEITFVLPKKIDLISPWMKIIFADNDPQNPKKVYSAYVTSEEYAKLAAQYGWDDTLIDEVMKYSILAREIAKNESFELIHAHDWLSFRAGIEAKKISGKPLIVHVHATQFDWAGGKVNDQIYQIEKKEWRRLIRLWRFLTTLNR
jgi:glycogen(starch) synthase